MNKTFAKISVDSVLHTNSKPQVNWKLQVEVHFFNWSVLGSFCCTKSPKGKAGILYRGSLFNSPSAFIMERKQLLGIRYFLLDAHLPQKACGTSEQKRMKLKVVFFYLSWYVHNLKLIFTEIIVFFAFLHCIKSLLDGGDYPNHDFLSYVLGCCFLRIILARRTFKTNHAFIYSIWIFLWYFILICTAHVMFMYLGNFFRMPLTDYAYKKISTEVKHKYITYSLWYSASLNMFDLVSICHWIWMLRVAFPLLCFKLKLHNSFLSISFEVKWHVFVTKHPRGGSRFLIVWGPSVEGSRHMTQRNYNKLLYSQTK